MSLINVDNVSFSFGGDQILDKVSLAIEDNSKIGLVGNNGCGKTTLFKIINREYTPESGKVHVAKNRMISYLSQNLELNAESLLFDEMLNSRSEILETRQRIKDTELLLAGDPEDQSLLRKLDNLHDSFTAMKGYDYENEIEKVLTNLNFARQEWTKPVKLFSGGERTRIQLAKVLLAESDILLLDEPTNHLDLFMLDWLEKYLINLNKPYLIISHNRHFLDRTVKTVFELRGMKLFSFKGNYSQYEEQSALIMRQKQKQFKEQSEFIKRTEDFIRKNMAGQKVNQAKSRLKMLNRMDKIDLPENENNLKIDFSITNRSGNIVYEFSELSFGYEDKILGKNINTHLMYGDRVALIGRNGCGKTSFFKLMLGEIEPLEGYLKMGSAVKPGYYDQDHCNLDDNLTAMETIWQLMPAEAQGKVYSWLARFGFRNDDVEKKAGILSGGERARLYLAKLVFEKPNLLILDEPTNHLDIRTIKFLEDALKNYEGTLIFVSHDIYFIKNIANKIWTYEDETIDHKLGNLEEILDDFQNSDEQKPKKDISNQRSGKKLKEKKVNPILLEKILQEINRTQNLKENKENEISDLEKKFSQKDTYSSPEKVKKLKLGLKKAKTELNSLIRELDRLESEYLELCC